MKRRWLLNLLAVLAVCLALLLPAAPAVAAGDDFLPDPPSGMVTWSTPPLYDRYPVWHYVWGARLQGMDTVYRLTYLVNLLQVGKAWLLKLGIRSVEYALHLDLTTPLIAKAGESMRSLRGLLWVQDGAPWVAGGLVAAAALAMWSAVFRGRRDLGVRLLAGATVVLVGSYALLEVAPETVATAAGTARVLGQQVVSAGAAFGAPKGGEGMPAERLLRSAGESAWRALVLDPWLDGEFIAGAPAKPDYKEGDVDGGKWLSYTPTDRSRRYNVMSSTTQVQDLHQWDPNYVMDYLPRRVVLASVSFVVTLAYAGVLLLLAGGVLYYQIVLLVMLVMAPVWLLLALWHPSGLGMVRGAVVRALGALVFQVVLTTVLTVLLLLVGPVAALAAPMGWVAQGLLLTLVAVALYRYRFRWLTFGREAVPQVGRLRERLVERHTAERTTRAVVREPDRAGVNTLPQYRDDRPDPALGARAGERRDETGPAGRAAADLALELSRVRERLHQPAGNQVVLQRSEQVRTLQEAAAGGRAAPPQEARAAGGGGRAPRGRPDQGQAVNLFRNR